MTETTQPPTADELAQWRKSHVVIQSRWGPACAECEYPWPCSVIRLLDALEAAQAEIERLNYIGPLPVVLEGVQRLQRDLERAQAVVEAARKHECAICHGGEVWEFQVTNIGRVPLQRMQCSNCHELDDALAAYDAHDAPAEEAE